MTRGIRVRAGLGLLLLVLAAAALAQLGTVSPGRRVDAWQLAGSLSAMALVLVGAWCRGRPWWSGLRDGLLVALTAGSLVAGTGVLRLPQAGTAQLRLPLHGWNQVHYVLGTKYFDELGYFDLYAGLLLVDEEAEPPGGERLTTGNQVRDLRTYLNSTRRLVLEGARESGLPERFTEARWESFSHDAHGAMRALGPTQRRAILQDLGFNPSPAWLILHEPLLQGVSVDGRGTLEGLAAWQIPLVLVAVGASLWAFGWRSTCWMLLWSALFFGNRGRLLGGYFSYDWAALAVIGAALVERGKPVLAAPFVAYAGLMRGFVGLVALGPTVRALWTALPGRPRDARAWAFCLTLGVSMAGVVGLSATTSHGLSAWGEWAQKIELHSARISAGGRRVGLQTLFGEDYSSPGATENMNDRRELLRGREVPLRLTQLGLLGLLVVVLRRRGGTDGYVLGLAAGFVLVVVSRYYLAVWMLWLLLGRSSDRPEGSLLARLGLFGLIAAFCTSRIVPGLPWGDTYQGRYQLVNLWLLGLILAMLSSALWDDLRRDVASPETSAVG